MMIELKEHERIDDLQRGGYGIIQNSEKFCFGMDAVLLSGFVRAEEGETLLDLGTGTGIIPILLRAKTGCRNFTGLEIQEDMADMARRSVAYNHLEDEISIVLGDIREASCLFGLASFDVVVSNPPYIKDCGGLKNPDMSKAAARHEVFCTLDDVAREASRTVKPGGRFYLVHRPARLAEIITVTRSRGLEPKRMRLVHPYADREANMVLLEAVRGGNPQLKVEPPIIVFKEPGVYSDEIREKYGY